MLHPYYIMANVITYYSAPDDVAFSAARPNAINIYIFFFTILAEIVQSGILLQWAAKIFDVLLDYNSLWWLYKSHQANGVENECALWHLQKEKYGIFLRRCNV